MRSNKDPRTHLKDFYWTHELTLKDAHQLRVDDALKSRPKNSARTGRMGVRIPDACVYQYECEQVHTRVHTHGLIRNLCPWLVQGPQGY